MEQVILTIGGMSCQSCVKNVTSVLLAVPGVERAEVSLEAGEANVVYDGLRVVPMQLKQAVEEAGFDAA